MAESLLVLLLGGRAQPALLTAAYLEPDAVLCIAPFGNGKPKEIATWLAGYLPRTVILPTVEVAPYRPEETRAAVRAAAKDCPSSTPMISLIGAPMPMGIGGYEAAKESGCPAFYLDTGTGQLMDLTARRPTEVIPMRLSVRKFAHVNNVRVRDAAPPADWDAAQKKHKAARDALRKDLRAAAALLTWLPKHDYPFEETLPWTLDERHVAMLKALLSCGVITKVEWLEVDGKRKVKVTVDDKADALFLKGFWLEQFVYEAACAARLPDGTPLFDECDWGLHFDAQGRAHREVDFIGVRGGTGLIASCKTSKDPWVKNNLGEVVSVGIPLGGDYLAKLYVTNQFRPQPGTQLYGKYVDFIVWAASQNVTVVTGDDLPDLQGILAQAAAGVRK